MRTLFTSLRQLFKIIPISDNCSIQLGIAKNLAGFFRPTWIKIFELNKFHIDVNWYEFINVKTKCTQACLLKLLNLSIKVLS